MVDFLALTSLSEEFNNRMFELIQEEHRKGLPHFTILKLLLDFVGKECLLAISEGRIEIEKEA